MAKLSFLLKKILVLKGMYTIPFPPQCCLSLVLSKSNSGTGHELNQNCWKYQGTKHVYFLTRGGCMLMYGKTNTMLWSKNNNNNNNFFKSLFFNWSIIALQNFVAFCPTSTCLLSVLSHLYRLLSQCQVRVFRDYFYRSPYSPDTLNNSNMS